MRANAHIAAILALAALSLSPARLHAHSYSTRSFPATRPPAHLRPTVKQPGHASHSSHKTAAASPAKKSHPKKKSAPEPSAATAPHKPKHPGSRRQPSAETPDPATINRIHDWVHSQHQLNTPPQRKAAAITNPSPKSASPDPLASDSTPRKATSDDFLRAAVPLPANAPADTPAPSDNSTKPAATHPQATHAALAPSQPARPEPARSRAAAAPPIPVLRAIRTGSSDTPQLDTIEHIAATPVILPSLYNKRGRLIVPPPLKGSHEILLRQNQVADREGLDRIQNDDDILALRDQNFLTALPLSAALQVDDRLPANRRFCRPWTGQFLATLSRAYYARFHTPLQVNSAVRTVEFQQRLLRTNGNAAPADGDTASPHLTGQAVDLAKHGLSLTQIAWLRGYLLPLVQQGKVDVEEEFQQSCFHISVYKKYIPPPPALERDLASVHHGPTPALATAIR